MKRLTGFVAVISIVLTVASCCAPAKTPVEIVEAWCQAYAAQDAEAMVSYELKSLGDVGLAERIAGYNDGFELIDSISLTDVSITVQSQEETTATVEYTCVEIIVWVGDPEEHEEATTTLFTLAKSGGIWLISDWDSDWTAE